MFFVGKLVHNSSVFVLMICSLKDFLKDLDLGFHFWFEDSLLV